MLSCFFLKSASTGLRSSRSQISRAQLSGSDNSRRSGSGLRCWCLRLVQFVQNQAVIEAELAGSNFRKVTSRTD